MFVNCRVKCGDDVVVMTANEVVNVDICWLSHPELANWETAKIGIRTSLKMYVYFRFVS